MMEEIFNMTPELLAQYLHPVFWFLFWLMLWASLFGVSTGKKIVINQKIQKKDETGEE